MKKIIELVNEYNLADKEINVNSKKRIILKHNIFYSIKIHPINDSQISIINNWCFGIIGKFLFKKRYNEYITFLNRIRDCFKENEINIYSIHYFPQS